ncbi:MAG: hypothetical protein IPJ19_10760 [Planctomycetes bacterium]|nr:hypothetical protein [Planctomycetota bacterium]
MKSRIQEALRAKPSELEAPKPAPPRVPPAKAALSRSHSPDPNVGQRLDRTG